MCIFAGGPELAGTRMSPFWILLELRMMEVVVTTGAIRCAKPQANRHHQQTNTQFLYRPHVGALKGVIGKMLNIVGKCLSRGLLSLLYFSDYW